MKCSKMYFKRYYVNIFSIKHSAFSIFCQTYKMNSIVMSKKG